MWQAMVTRQRKKMLKHLLYFAQKLEMTPTNLALLHSVADD